jgi:hypothetical protein
VAHHELRCAVGRHREAMEMADHERRHDGLSYGDCCSGENFDVPTCLPVRWTRWQAHEQAQVNMMQERKIKNANSDCTELPTVAVLNLNGGDLRLKTTAHTRSRAVATALGGANDLRDDGRANGKMERAKVEQRGRIWPARR